MTILDLGKLDLLIFLTFFTLNVAHAEQADLRTELGFKTLSETNVPDAIKKTADSTFEARVVYENSPADVAVIDLTDPKMSDADQKIDAIDKLDASEKVVIKKQFERCRREKIERQCPVYFTIEKATAFLAGGDGTYLVTNAHVVNGPLKLLSTLAKKPILDLLKQPQRILIYLFDHNGNLVFDPYINQAAIIKHGEPSSLAKLHSDWYAEDTDYAVIKLDKKIGEPIKIASSVQPGETSYHSGYPACTGCASAPNKTDPNLNRDRSPRKNSSGMGFYWTEGKIQDSATARSFINADWYLALAKLDQMVFLNADAQVGMSGGPILNEAGEAIGVFAGSKDKINIDGSMTVLSRGVRPPEFNQIK